MASSTGLRNRFAVNRPAVLTVFGVVAAIALAVIYYFVRRMALEYRNAPEAADEFRSKRDRTIINVQFQCVPFASIALPFAVAGLFLLFGWHPPN